MSDIAITGVATLEDAGPDDLSLVGSEAFVKQFEKTRAGAVLVQQKVKVPAAPNGTVILTVADADLAMTRVLEMFAQPHSRPAAGIDKQSRVDPSAKLEKDVAIGAFAMVGARLSDRTGHDRSSVCLHRGGCADRAGR